MPKNKKCFKAVLFGLAILATMVFLKVASAQETDKKSSPDYRIEVIIDTLQKTPYVQTVEREIRFVSPDGKILKTLPYKDWRDRIGIFISPYLKCLIKAKDTPAEWGKDSLGQRKRIKEARVEFSYINAKGEQKWKKNFEIIFTLEEADESSGKPYFFVFSRDGSRIVFVRNHIGSPSDIIVFDTLGKEVVSVYKACGIGQGSSIEISPDGKIVGAETGKEVDNKLLKHLFFLEVETGRTKIGKAEGEGWRVDFVLSSSPTPPKSGKIRLNWQPTGKNYVGKPGGGVITKEVTFDELPDDFSVLFK